MQIVEDSKLFDELIGRQALARASDFESWFYIGVESETKAPLQITDVKLLTIQGAPTGSPFDITPRQGAQQPTAQIDWPLVRAEITFNRAPDPKRVTPNSVFVFPMDGSEKRRVPQQNPTLSGNSATLVLADPVEAGTLEVEGGVDNSFTPPTAPVTAQDDGTALDAATTTQQGATSFCLFCKLANCVARSFLFDNPLAADA